MKSSTKGIIAVISFLVVFAIIALIVTTTLNNATRTDFSSVEAAVMNGDVEKLNINNDKVSVKYVKGHNKRTRKDYDEYAYSRDLFMQDLLSDYKEMRASKAAKAEAEVRDKMEGTASEEELQAAIDKAVAAVYAELPEISVSFNDRNAGSIWNILYPIIGIVLIGVMAFFLFRSMGGQNKQAMNFGKSKANAQANLKVRFTDVAGADEEKQELAEIVEFLKSPKKFTDVGARIPKGVLLVGPPGTGKTLFAKAVAGEANVPFFSISGSDFVEMFVGVGASRVRDLFDQAKKNMPCIIFIDEIDAVGRQRGAGLGGGHDEREQTLNQLLVQMDGFETNDGVIVMAATNRADILDPALLRPGRFDRQIYVNIPDVRGREAIFKVHARNKPISPDVDFQVLARITSGFSGAEIANLLNEAAILCARDNRTQISMEALYEGINKVVMGPQKKSRLVTEVDKRITAYHEAGHAIVARLEPMCDPVHEVSIIPRGQAAGYTMTRPESDDNHMTIGKLKANLAMSMGGRAAEELVIEDITTGAVGDIKHATDIARKMVTEWGMSELGPVYYGSNQEVFLGRDYQSTHTYSETVATKIDDAVAALVETAHKEAVKKLTEHRKIMDCMVRLLIERETIYTEEVDMIMDGKSYEEVRDALDARLAKKYNNDKTA